MIRLEPPYGGFGVGVIAVVIPAQTEKLPEDANVVALEPQFNRPREPRGIESGSLPLGLSQLGGHSLINLTVGLNLALSRQTSHPFGCYPVKIPFWVQPELTTYDPNIWP